jgi:signal transduction histidine kinase/CheY-like chemotaxis protein
MRASHSSSVFFYFVAVALGLSFSGTLLLLAWDSAVESANRAFAFESVNIDDTVRMKARDAHDSLEATASYLATGPHAGPDGFLRFSRDAMRRHEAIAAIGWYRLSADRGMLTLAAWYGPEHEQSLPRAIQLGGGESDTTDLAAVLTTDQILPLGSDTRLTAPEHYLLVRRVLFGPPGHEETALAAVLVDAAQVLGQLVADPHLDITLYSESEGVSGRQQLYRKPQRADDAGWAIKTLNQSTQVRFERYSIRVTASRSLYWQALDKGLLSTALILSLGVTLLFVALARAKDHQARDLRERNRVIEEQVRRQTAELAEARDQAVEASRVKSDFLASMSHEIRTPLNAIIGMAELLSETRLTTEQQHFVAVFRNAGEALLSLVNDILDLSKIEAGQLVLERIPFDLRELVEQSADIYALKASSKGLELAVDVAGSLPAQVSGDPARLRQIILNLISNAIKFTEHGEIVVSVTPDADGRLRFAVRDTGIGIPAGKQEAIFASFTQVDSSTTRKYGGTGLGLTISRKLVDMMGGRLWVESREGEGSTFHFELALDAAPGIATPETDELAAALAGVPVLVIDDNATNRFILAEILVRAGAEVVEAASGPDGIAAFRARRDSGGRPFELVLCDGLMPGQDGFSVIEDLIREGGAVRSLMMLSSSNLAADLERARSLGLGAYLVKPIKRAELLRAVAESLVPVAPPVAADQHEGPADAEHGARILLVEDNEDNRLLIRTYLKREPYAVDEATNGAEAVAMFAAGTYDLILMDVQMPIMDGHEATRAIRRLEAEAGRGRIPIVALTAHAIKEDMERSLEAGCTAHLTKPIKKQTLLTALTELLGASPAGS